MALTAEELRRDFVIGEALVQPARNRIGGPEGEAHVEPKVMAVLLCLAENAGEVVSRQTLYDAVWGKAVVSDQALTNCISELRRHLGDDRALPRYIETVPRRGYRLLVPVRPANDGVPAAGAPRGRRPVATASLILAAAAALGLLAWWSLTGTGRALESVVVVPFENSGTATELDYLRLALPDEITTLLIASGGLIVRPFEHEAHRTPLEAGRARAAEHVVTGHFYPGERGALNVAVEAQEVAGERLVWSARITVPAGDLLALREQVAERVHRGLLPALGVAAPESGQRPVQPEAYSEYLRSLALPRHPEQAARAIAMLERAVRLDPGFAPAWTALGSRRYEDGNYGGGGQTALKDALAAWEQALEHDPQALPAALGIIKLQTESGELEHAYARARHLLARFGHNADAHLALAYVYKYGGMLEESQQHCETAFAIDRHNPDLRSCGYSFLYAGELDRVQAMLDADQGSYFSYWGTVLLNLRRGDDAAALTAARRVAPDRHTRRLMEPCLEGRRGAELDEAAAAFVAFWSAQRDPELAYGLAPMLEYCGRRDEALDFLERAIAGNFCAFPALDQDPVWAGLTEDARFRRLREAAIACHSRFREVVSGAAA